MGWGMRNIQLSAILVLALPLLGGAKGDGCAANSKSPAPDVNGWWDVTYDDTIGVEVKIGAAVYTRELGAQGGVIDITHEGRPFRFNLDCGRPEVLCPSEAWPASVQAQAWSRCSARAARRAAVAGSGGGASTAASTGGGGGIGRSAGGGAPQAARQSRASAARAITAR